MICIYACILACFGRTTKAKWLAFNCDTATKSVQKKVGCIQHEHMQGRDLTSVFANNVNQACKLTRDHKVKHISEHLQDQTFIAQSQTDQYCIYC